MSRERAVGLAAKEDPIACRDDEQPPVGQKVDAEGKRLHLRDDLARALEIDGDDLLRAPVREPQSVLVPAW
jgi:hypothetical protein